MKKLSYLFVSLFIAAALFSCQKEGSNEIVLKSQTVKAVSGPETTVKPYIIPGDNNGGNRTCAEVEAAFSLPAGYYRCGEKIDYNNGSFAGNFPDGLAVTVTDGTFVAFELKDCIEIDGRFFKVGAVIVKGGNDANVYYYEKGSLGDSGLASPVNKNGKPAGLSNLSFCFVECIPEPELVMVMKTYLAPYPVDENASKEWAGTSGEGSGVNSLHLGYIKYDYKGININPIYYAASGGAIGTISASDYYVDGIRYLEVVLNLNEGSEWQFGESFLYVGSIEGYKDYLMTMDALEYTQFGIFPFHVSGISGVRTFIIPFSDIKD
jgi:hypothetical protein